MSEDPSRYEPMYTVDKNPHSWLSRINETGTEGIWRCMGCFLVGTFKYLESFACPKAAVPCLHCGLAPICAKTCPGMMGLLMSDNVYLAGLSHE